MSQTRSLRRNVRERAGDRCEYCHMPQRWASFSHQVDHVRAQKHRGPTTLQNTCYACAACNGAKGTNVAGYDPLTDDLVPLYNPRVERWADHFAWRGPRLNGLTAVGRATVEVLRINAPDRIEQRRFLLAARAIVLD